MRDWFTEIHARLEATMRAAEKHATFATELEGVRFALDTASAISEIAAGAQLLAAIELAWVFGFLREGVARIEAFIAALPDHEVLLLARLSATLASLFRTQGIATKCLEIATKACAYARTSGDGPTLAFALSLYAYGKLSVHDFADADAALVEAAAIPLLSARLRLGLSQARAHLSAESGDLDAAARGFEQLVAEHRTLGNLRNVHVSVLNLAETEFARGRTARAIALVREALPAVKLGSDVDLCSAMLSSLAGYLVASGDLADAVAAAHETMGRLARDPDHFSFVGALEHLALVDALRGRFSRAARLAAYTDAVFAKRGFKREVVEQTTHDRLVTLLDANLTPEERANLSSEGAALSPETASALALEIAAD
jgi:tetratricopeptide (TPR) repeat protein